MSDIKTIFSNIGRNDIDENVDDLFEKKIMDSIAIMDLVGAIEDFYGIEIDFDYLEYDNFKNLFTIQNMIESILSNE
ncbi:TPA: acyl carrier protein [Campylobacter lari]|nr:acyl carrier protein [Campylobacter lari]EDP6880614.1 acyl carrier protein [Campylobacter lari]TDJ90825.1 acyl carrier protein [Campylobacter lari]HEC1798073.1 acyl carrier protein [Campylobacter lari]